MGLERLAAGIVVIGLILWGASILATPTEGREPIDVPAVEDPPADAPADDAVPEGDDEEEEETDEPEPERRKRGKRDGGG